MKKAYIAPVILIEETESDTELMTVSNPGVADYELGGVNGNGHYEGNNISGTGESADDDDWAVGAKGGIAFNDSWEEEMW